MPRIADPRGNLTVAEAHSHLPFGVARVYWVYDVPAGECRGGHAHKACREFIVAVSGSFTVTLDDGSVHHAEYKGPQYGEDYSIDWITEDVDMTATRASANFIEGEGDPDYGNTNINITLYSALTKPAG